jgi:probable rRNA maturation factor
VIVGDDYIHDLNRQYLGHDCTTDVITFPLSEEGRPIEGEVYINAELAARVADDHGWHAENELLLYLVHGLLHLTGFDDHTPSERAEMFQEQQRCLCEAGLPEALVRRAVPESDPTS